MRRLARTCPTELVVVAQTTVAPLANLNGDSNITVIGGYAGAVIRALEARGIPIETTLAASGIEAVPGNDPAQRLPLDTVRKLLDAAVELTADPYFGLYAAKFIHPVH